MPSKVCLACFTHQSRINNVKTKKGYNYFRTLFILLKYELTQKNLMYFSGFGLFFFSGEKIERSIMVYLTADWIKLFDSILTFCFTRYHPLMVF